MVDKPGHYWDVDECAWVRCPTAQSSVEVPAQQTGVESTEDSDVRSG